MAASCVHLVVWSCNSRYVNTAFCGLLCCQSAAFAWLDVLLKQLHKHIQATVETVLVVTNDSH